MICETKKIIIYEMRKRGILPSEIMVKFNVKYWQVISASKIQLAKFECTQDNKFKLKSKRTGLMPYPELTGIIAPLYTPYGTALTIGDVFNYGV